MVVAGLLVVANDGLLGVEDSGNLFRGRRRRRRRRREKSRWRSRPQKDMMKKSRGERTRSEEIFRRSSSRRWGWWCCCCRELSREMLWSRTRRWETAVFAVARSGDCEIEGHSSEAVVVWQCCDLHSPSNKHLLSVQTALLQEAVEREDVSGGEFDPGWLLADGCQRCGLPLPVEIRILLERRRRRRRVGVVSSSLVRSGEGAAVVVLHRIMGAFRGGGAAGGRGRRGAEG
jgi:hypothetical protein